MCSMKRAILVAAVLMASSSIASAGGYLGLGIGPKANVNGTDGHFEAGGRSYRLLGGLRFGRLAIEASVTGQDVFLIDNGGGQYDAKQLGLAGKYNLPLGSNFEAFAKLGVHRTWLSNDSIYDVAGNGLLVGGGFEYRLNAVITNGSLFVDYTHHAATLEGDIYAFDGGVGMWMLGFTIGI